jgi:sulfatase maturation enzyme AslB (radical SAM superfamily)
MIRIFAEPQPAVPDILTRPLKTSCFVWIAGGVATNDLTDEQRPLSALERLILTALAAAPDTPARLQAALGCGLTETADAARSLVAAGYLVDAGEDESGRFAVHRVDIETLSHCNARCGFCPQSVDPKPKQIMTMELFERVVGEIAPFAPRSVALNNFNEPLLDPFFVERCRLLEQHGLTVALFTNATVLRPAVLDYLRTSRVLQSITVNLPSDEADEWAELMRLPPALHARTVENVRALADAFHGPVAISVNARTPSHRLRTERVAALFAAQRNVSVLQLESNTLAGSISGDLVGPATLTPASRLGGCNRLANHLHISVAGDVFMCCLDYAQKYKFGNVSTEPVAAILAGPLARKYRAQVYGLECADSDLICRSCCHIRSQAAD